MTTEAEVTCNPDHVKSQVMVQVERALEWLFAVAESGGSARRLEQDVWRAVLVIGTTLLGAAMAVRCRRSMLDDLRRRGLDEGDVRLRLGADYWSVLTTTLGKVLFPLFAYRRRAAKGKGSTATRNPAREEVLPLFPHTRSSELLVEWESRLGCLMPFRHAQRALTFFTHGAVTVEDTTLSRHMVAAGTLADSSWQYRKCDEIRKILAEDATRDKKTGRPLVYASTDAHALRRYSDETWSATWKMANGIRLWCVCRRTGRIIHLGGEYTWGDCEQVEKLFALLQERGLLPADGDYGEGVQAQVVLLTDGAPWIRERIAPMFPGALVVLDAFHAMERASKEAAAIHGKGTPEATAWYHEVLGAMFGEKPADKPPKKPKKRRGHTKKRRSSPSEVEETPTTDSLAEVHDSATALADLVLLDTWLDADHPHAEDYETFANFVETNAHRMNYAELRARGVQIGSGAMEALHPIASQARLKRPGARWLPRTSQAILNLRMMDLAGRWDEFWDHPDLPSRLAPELANTNSLRAA
jgi:hypothetical protein